TERLQAGSVQLKTQTVDAERELQNYKVANHLLNPERGKGNSEQLAAMKTQLANARMAMVEAKARLDRPKQTIKEGKPNGTTSDSMTNSIIGRLRSQYLDLAANVSEIEARVGPEHGASTKIRERMTELRTLIRAEEERIAGSYANEYQI